MAELTLNSTRADEASGDGAADTSEIGAGTTVPGIRVRISIAAHAAARHLRMKYFFRKAER